MSKTIEQVIAESYFMIKDASKELSGQTSELASNSPLALDVPSFMADGFARMDTALKATLTRNPASTLIPELEMLT